MSREPDEPSQNLSGLALRPFMLGMGQSDPIHLQPVVDVLEAIARGEKVRAVIAAPRQHGKSTLILNAIPWLLIANGRLPIAYATYGQQFSGKQSRVARDNYRRAGGKLSEDHNTIQEWHTSPSGGFCLATSIDGPLTGYTVRVGIIDDPFKGRAEAESLERRELAHAWLKGDMMGCVGPKGSIIIVASRYHEDDLSGRMLRERWDEIRIPAICDDETTDPLGRKLGEPLCPWGPDPEEPRTLDFLRGKELEVGPYDWASLFQGRPAPKGGKIFRDAFFYDELPPLRRIVVGCDMAYSTGGDRIALVVLGESDLLLPTREPILYVLHVLTLQKSIIEAADEVLADMTPWRRVPWASYVAGPEIGAIQALARHEDRSKRQRIQALPAKLSKLNRAGRCSRRWNLGGVRVKRDAPWADEYVRVMCGFTGLDGQRDDEADATVSGFDRLVIGETFGRKSFKGGCPRVT